ncbi:PepSY-associated TM helix domain-containing protein [Roseisolibacter sp. H3M3-2]|uniref:PepSY-associated TM helix domain-containing protein n=1 Tax=Roseisolibacter sp. H3M3-2 TaxID=3031323 RepID=UPI0023DC36B2|nr:PepSY-associated TM helix domain-containing protein [Roseisolibacter sp. H3M3-2]MDF1503995.1 PepSY-associated TM helix domain-containing protein [Roseisolibacter sp. H3M3-2]
MPTSPAPRRRGLWTGAVRPALFWAHLAAGVAAGAVVLVMSLTGVLLTYQRQVTAWSTGSVTPPAGGARLPLDTLVARVRAAEPGVKVTGVTVKDDPTAPVAVGVEPRRTVAVDPYTGAVLPGSPKVRAFFSEVERWHRSLATGESVRDKLGVRITGASNVAFLFLLLTGAVLWWPRKVSRRSLRAVLVPTFTARGRARDWNWHHVMGAWTAPVMLAVVFTAAMISYAWPAALVIRAFGGEPPRAEAPRAPARGGEARPAGPAFAPDLDALMAQAGAAAPGWKQLALRYPANGAKTATITASATASNRPDGRTTLTVDAASGAITKVQPYAQLPVAQKVRSWVRPVHTGEAAGVVGQTLAGLASAAGVGLVWTGLALTLRRLLARARRRTLEPVEEGEQKEGRRPVAAAA